jgi:hypothetical protein
MAASTRPISVTGDIGNPADGVGVLDVWRREPFQALGIEQRTVDPVNPYPVCELPLVPRTFDDYCCKGHL